MSLTGKLGYRAIGLGVRTPARFEVFRQQCRTIDEIKRLAIDVVFDVGANEGFYAKHLRMLGFRGTILSFEPDPTTYTRLVTMAKGDRNWRTFNCALGETAGEMDFRVIHHGNGTTLSSALVPTDWLENLPFETIKVPVRTVAEMMVEERIGGQIFLKMDTQGFDLKVFAGAGNHSAIKLLQSEVSVHPLYEGMPHYTEALAHYEQAGFELLDLFVVCRDVSGAVAEYDAIMRRK